MQEVRAARDDQTAQAAAAASSGSAPRGQELDDGSPPGGPDPAAPVPGPALSIAGAARGLGVATATLRSWERRYGLAPSLHTPGGHRRYGSDDLGRLQVMHRLVRAGVPPADAARVAIAAHYSSAADSSGPFAALLWGHPTPVPESPAPPASAPSGGGRVLALPRGTGATARGLARSALALDAVSCERILDRSFATQGTVDTWDRLVRPVMAAIGHRWEATQTGVEVEHMFSAVACAALARRSRLPSRVLNTGPVILASVPEELHDLPLRALQSALAEQGIRAQLLGARTPARALADAVRRLGPPVVVLWAQMTVTELPELPAIRPTPALILGGPGIQDVAEARPHAHSLVEALRLVRAALTL